LTALVDKAAEML